MAKLLLFRCLNAFWMFTLTSQIQISDSLRFINLTNDYLTTEGNVNFTTEAIHRNTNATFVDLHDELTSNNFESSSPLSSKLAIVDERCSNYRSCEPPAFVKFSFCKCDIECEKYNDCCLNYDRIDHLDVSSTYECIPKTNAVDNFDGFFAIATCPSLYRNDTMVIDKCHQNDVLQHGPSVVSNNLIYKNKYCALCHNESDFRYMDVQFYNVWLDIAEFENFTKLSREKKLAFASTRGTYQLIPPIDAQIRRCVSNLTVGVENKNCTSFINPVFSVRNRKLKLYRNFNCAPFEERDSVDCLGSLIRGLTLHGGSIHKLSVIFTFRDLQPQTAVNDVCQEWSEKIAAEGQCSELETYKNKEVSVEYYLVPTSNTNPTKYEFLMSALLTAWTYEVSNFTNLKGFNIKVAANEEFNIYKVTMKLKLEKQMFLHEMNEAEKSLRKRTVELRMNKNSTYSSAFLYSTCKLPTNLTNIPFKAIYTFRIVTSVRDQLLIQNIDVSSITIGKLCDMSSIEIMLDTDSKIHLESYSCQQRQEPIVERSAFPTLAVITYVCFSLSAVSLILLLIHIRKYKFHLKIPGNNLENLSLSLLISNVLFMVGINESLFHITHLCYVIGVLLHYLWLLTFSFMTISVVYIASTLVNMKVYITVHKEDVQSWKWLIMIVGLLFPLIFVVPAVAVDNIGIMSLGYSQSICFPNLRPSNILFFTGPVIVLIFTNFVCLSYTIYKVRRIRIDVTYVRKSVSFQDAMVYFRIVVLSGVFWITGIMAVAFETQWLDYIFTFLCGLQGFFVAIANMSTIQFRQRNPSDISDY